MKNSILLVDDHKIIRDGLKIYIEGMPHFFVFDEASNGREALAKLEGSSVSIVVLDINMDGMDGIQCAKEISQRFEEVKVLALSMHNDYQYIKKMVDAGVNGYLLKSCSRKEFEKALNSLASGEKYFSPLVTQTIMNNLTQNKKSCSIQTTLTPREIQVLELIVGEYTNKEIADSLFISLRTVDAHKRNLLEKTNSKNIAGLVKFALKNGFLSN